MKDEIIIYRSNGVKEHIEVRFDEETVWLTQQQMALLFNQTKQNISLHIRNCFKEKELSKRSTVKESLTVQKEGERAVKRKIEYYNLDVIISVGYRVKSKQGTQFRIWANRVLKEYLLKGFSINNRMNKLENNIEELKGKVSEINLQINTHLIPTQGVFFEGQIFDAYELASKIIRTTKENIILIDNYIDESVLTQLCKRKKGVRVILLTKNINKQLLLDIQKANEQYPTIEVKSFSQSHDRFLIIDNTEVYHLGASLKDLGKKWFAFSKIDKSALSILTNVKKYF